ncbi:unnamed protein product [Miscanthus lutarioriparius]|uniref:DUF4220 domain-containing protein n=1 Tax=Miscanthus lutarioriparius TaxID=422564 RepID=A0A811NXT8_9POAL|nr:unnamed protein product [Miscanthus lutarioriparius]
MLGDSTLEDLGNGGVIAAAVLAVLLVALSTYGRRLCRHPAVRFFVWGASMVFLPLSSAILSALLSRVQESKHENPNSPTGRRNPDVQNMWTLLLWLVLILTLKCNANMAATAVTAAASSPAEGDAGVDGYSIRPPVENLAAYAWLAYLIWLCVPVAVWLGHLNKAIFFLFSALGLAKLALKLAAFYSASGSFALGKNARLIAGYMEQLVADGGLEQVPRYIVMGEKKKHVEESPRGYRVKRDALQDKFSGLVTLDRVWRLAEHGDGVLAERVELRDLCLSYSLFKILRRRLSGYPLADAGSVETLSFVLRGMDSAGTGGAINADRVFRVLVDELWFASDFYYSPIPLCIFGGWCAALNYICSVLIIVGAVAVGWIYQVKGVIHYTSYKVITYFLLLTVVLVEAWEIVASVCSNWTKMALLGHYIRHQSLWRRSSCFHVALTANSVLEPRRFRRRTGLLSELLYGSSGLMKSLPVSPLVRDAVLRSLLSSYGDGASQDSAAARRVGGKVDWAMYGSHKSWAWDADGSSNTELILVWHVGTRLLEMKSTSASPDMIAACHLSYYCAYLVAVAPELLPDSAAWTRRRYKEVSDDVRAALGADGGGGGTESTAERYERLLAELSKDSRDTVLRRGAELGRHLVEEYAEDEASACRILADFWAEMLLFVAPSENVKGHVQAMARGGEFITLVWVLLLHAGVTTRPNTTPGGAIP